MLTIRPAAEEDFAGIWPIIRETFQGGETYPFPGETTEEEGYLIWMKAPLATYVAISEGQMVGTYYLKANQPGLGSHVCNAGYVVSSASRRQGIGRSLCEHSLIQARNLGFIAMQYNLVVSTNTTAVKLWESCGFKIIGTIPKAFNSRSRGLVDAFVMYRLLSVTSFPEGR